jgi:substrate import-associated zinc metallohydrolase lipoprotein
MKNINILTILFFICIITSCNKEDDLGSVDEIPGLGGDPWVKGPIDNWIYNNLTKPFNISVKYKWDQFELELNKNLVPPKEEKIIPVLEAVKKVWIDTYIAEAGAPFIRKFCPKFFVLCGSASWNTDGTITLGTAEGGRKVALYVLNEFRSKSMPGYQPSDSLTIKMMFHTIEHAQAEARAKLRQKEAMVVAYFKDIWGMDFYRLQTRTRAAVTELIR